MTETWSRQKPRDLNEETIADVRRRIGIPVRYSPRAHNEVSSTDSFRHFALAYGDDNPLYTDPAYAAASSWGTGDRAAAVPLRGRCRAPGPLVGRGAGADEVRRSTRGHRAVHVR